MSIAIPVSPTMGAILAALALSGLSGGLSGTLAATALLPGRPAGQWPVPDPVVTSGFRPPARDWESGHRGVDLAAPPGTQVRAATDGLVTVAGPVAGRSVVAVALPGAGRMRVTYEPVVPRVRVGDVVRAGDVLGVLALVGGHCGGAAGCLHLGLRTDIGYLDPLRLIEPAPAVLKPR